MNGSKKTSADITADNIRRPVSLRLLYEGMVVLDDIYDSSGERLLITADNVLQPGHLERIRRLNAGSDTIYVTGRTHKVMLEKKPAIEVERRVDLEDSTGHTTALSRANELLRTAAAEKKINRDRFYDLAKKLSQRVKTSPEDVIVSLINAIAPDSEFLKRHIVNVAMLNGLLGLWLDLPDEQVDKLVLIGLLHDCGQALMPKAILHARRKLSIVEYEVIKMHTICTAELLFDYPDDIRLTAISHHERLDGSGYPTGIAGDELTDFMRITAVSDIYEAIVAARPYKPTRSPFYVLAMLDGIAPEQLDRNVVNTIRDHLPKLLVDKPVKMSDGTIGIVREYDPKNIEFPTVEISKRMIRTNQRIHCVSMYNDE